MRHSVAGTLVYFVLTVGLTGPSAGADYFARTAIVLEPTFFSNVEWSLLEDGRVYFEAFRMSTGTLGLHITGGPGGFQTIMESGDPAPELDGLTMNGPSGEWVGVDGGYAFGVGLVGPGVHSGNDFALYAGTLSSGPRLIFREGDEVPGMPGILFDFGATSLRVNPAGDVFFLVGLASGPNGAALIAEMGDVLTVVTAGSFTGLLRPVLHPSGAVAFVGFLDGEWGIWSGPPASIQRLISEGDPAPETASFISELKSVSFASATRLAFSASLTSGANALFSDLGGSPRAVVETLAPVAGMTTSPTGRLSFLEFSVPVAIRSEQNEPSPSVIASGGQQAPEMPAGVEFFDLGNPIHNAFGQVAFAAQLDGPGVGTSNDVSVWVYDPVLGAQPIAREGSTIQIGPADTRTIVGITPALDSIHGASLQDGVQKKFNNSGELAFLATFTDGQSALLVGQRQTYVEVFSDGFESGDLSAW